MTRPRLLVVGSGGKVFREYALAAMSRRASLVLASKAELTWQAPYVDDVAFVDPDDPVALLEAAREARIDGVLTYDELLVERVAQVAQELGLPSAGVAPVRRCKDKLMLRDRLKAAGLSGVAHAVADDVQEAVAAAAGIGYPLVLKPRALGGSIGVVRVDDERELVDKFGVARDARAEGVASAYTGVVLEEYVDGPEYSLDAATWNGVTTPLVLAEKTVAFPPYFEETAHLVPGTPRDGLEDAIGLVVAAHRAIGLDRLVTHSEFRLSSRGPRIIEINARLGGDLIPYLGQLASDVDLAGAAASIALDREPDLSRTEQRTAGVVMVYPEHDLRFESAALRRDPATYEGLERFEVIATAGSELRLPPRGFLFSRVAFAIVTGASRAECEARMQAVRADVVINASALNGS